MSEIQDPEEPIPNQSLSPIPLHVGSALINPADMGKVVSQALQSMNHYANQELELLKSQAELIMKQVREIETRVEISQRIYEAEMRFIPKIMGTYYLYEKKNGGWIVSMVGPQQWGKSFPYLKYKATVKLLGDRTWDVIEKND